MLKNFVARRGARQLMLSSSWLSTNALPKLRTALVKAEGSFGLSGNFTAEMFNLCVGGLTDLISKVRGSDHPVVSIIKDVQSEHVTGYKATGTLVSLFSQLKRTGSMRTGDSKSVRENHERIVKVAEMQHVTQLLHSSVMQTKEHNDEAKKNWELGDKLAVLLGDFFYALAFKEITETQDLSVLSTFAKGIESFAASSFEEIPHCVSTEWWKDFTPRQCSWFPSAFECSLLVAGVKCQNERAEARKCGTNLVLAMQAREIINHFLKNQGQIPEMSVEEVSLMALQFGCSTAASVSSSKLCEANEQEMAKFQNLLTTCSDEILEYIDGCEESSEQNTMETIMTCLKKS